jgi:hypothetical protein
MHSLNTNIAVQRAQLQTQIERRCLAIRLTICFDQTKRRSPRFSPASDVLPFPGLLLSPDQVRLSNISK